MISVRRLCAASSRQPRGRHRGAFDLFPWRRRSAAMAAEASLLSKDIMSRSRDLFPGGVNSPVRAFRGVGGDPIVAASGEGARIRDADGKEYIDYVLSWGPLVLGHAHPMVLDAIDAAMRSGTSFGMPTELEVLLGELIRSRMP